ncbi:MAG TPA: hypothetical protein VK934_07665 [Fimbriimonas sp.]|nr:hypothetical protein [Fimbriimonas sp.]
MKSVEIPEDVYDRASEAAAIRGLSVDALVEEILAAELKEGEPFVLTPEQLIEVNQSLEDMRNGKYLTWEESKTRLADFRRQWLQEHSR